MINEKLLPQIENFTNKVTFKETNMLKTIFEKQGNLINIAYGGQAKTHSKEELIFVLPVGYRPKNSFWVTSQQNTDTSVLMFFNANGNVSVSQISSTSNSGRIYINVSYFVN